MKKRDAEQRIIDTARLVLLGWLGDTIDSGKAMREALGELRVARMFRLARKQLQEERTAA